MNKNKYYVVNIYSSHNNFANAASNRDQQIKAGKNSKIFYRGQVVTEDVKKIKPQPEGI
jgi:hypothetical protein